MKKKKVFYIYTDDDSNKYFYSYHKVSNDGEFFELRCTDRNNF